MAKVGAFPYQEIASMIDAGVIQTPDKEAAKRNIQPSSLDLLVGDRIWRIKGSFLPKYDEPVQSLIERYAISELDLGNPNHRTLERNSIYIAELQENLRLFPEVYGYANNKSSTGRLSLHTKLLTDRNPRFERVTRGYNGKLYAEIIPKALMTKISKGVALNQMRFFNGDSRLDDVGIRLEHMKNPLLYDRDGSPVPADSLHLNDGLLMTIDLEGVDTPWGRIVGWKAKKNGNVLDLTKKQEYDPEDFFEPIKAPKDGALVLNDGEFYLLATRERISVPTHLASEMQAYDPDSGDFRSHYAGFFDPGFGYGKGGEVRGTQATLEFVLHKEDKVFWHGQPICKMIFERMRVVPEVAYGESGSHYQRQMGPTLSKHFRVPLLRAA